MYKSFFYKSISGLIRVFHNIMKLSNGIRLLTFLWNVLYLRYRTIIPHFLSLFTLLLQYIKSGEFRLKLALITRESCMVSRYTFCRLCYLLVFMEICQSDLLYHCRRFWLDGESFRCSKILQLQFIWFIWYKETCCSAVRQCHKTVKN